MNDKITHSDSISPVFILGTQRSGTTLLTRILSSHTDLFIQNEVNVVQVFKNSKSKTDILQALDTEVLLRHQLTIPEMLAKTGKQYWGVKDPQLTEYIPQLKFFLPSSKFIIIVRDARGVVNSYKQNKWGLGTNVYTGTQRWITEVTLQKKFMQEHPEQCLLLRYEDILHNATKEVEKACTHLQIKFEANMLDYYLQKTQFKKNKSNINTNKKPDGTFAEKWKKELSVHEINIIEHLAKDELKTSGYELVGSPINIPRWEKYYYRIHQAIIGELQIQYQLKRIFFRQQLKSWGLLK